MKVTYLFIRNAGKRPIYCSISYVRFVRKKDNNSQKSLDKEPAIEYNPSVNSKAAFNMPRSSSGLGHRPFKAEITGSNPVRGTLYFAEESSTTTYLSCARLLCFLWKGVT